MLAALTLPRPAPGLTQHAARLWRAYPRETVGFGLLGAIALAAAAIQLQPAGSPALLTAPPAPPPMVVRQLAPEQALAVNQAIPLTTGPSPAATPFPFKGNAAVRAQALECLTSAVYYEAGSQTDDGQRAVAQVVLNRVRHPAFPSSVCGVGSAAQPDVSTLWRTAARDSHKKRGVRHSPSQQRVVAVRRHA